MAKNNVHFAALCDTTRMLAKPNTFRV